MRITIIIIYVSFFAIDLFLLTSNYFNLRFLRRISKFVHNEKLESYLNTFEDINNEIITKLPAPKDWATWCTERYDCNSHENSSNKVETKQ